jgi:hypothetical protein
LSPGEPDGLIALDALARQLRAGAGDLRVAVARTPDEVVALAVLRERIAAGAGRDDHDTDALQIGAWDGDEPAGTMRLVLPVPGRRLPVEEAFDLIVEPAGAVTEAGRLVVSPEQRGDPAHRIWGALFAIAWFELRARGLSVLAGTASPRMVARLTALGLPFEVLGPARPYWGEDRHPVRLDPSGGRPRWY